MIPKALCQSDRIWALTKIGKTNFTVARFGCTLTCLSMATDYYQRVKGKGQFLTPGELAQKFSFNAEGCIIWSSMPGIVPFKLGKRLYNRDDFEIMIGIKDPKRVAILQVNHGHWVFALSKEVFGGGYRIIDPIDGKVKSSRRYREITGSAILELIL